VTTLTSFLAAATAVAISSAGAPLATRSAATITRVSPE
jgi:hypothetical protein